MYIQITTRCNMTCGHCCFACTAKGHDMSMEHFKMAVALALDNESTVCIGGGEPTLHPLFKDMLWHAIWELAGVAESNGCPAVHMVTNGSITPIALKLAKLAERGVISCNLSRDSYHDPIDERVVSAFTKPYREHYAPRSASDEFDCRGINKEAHYIQRMGRAKDWGNRRKAEGCCGGVCVHPKGILYPCTCRTGSIGTLEDPHSLISEHFTGGYCVGSKEYKTEVLPMIKEHKEWELHHVTVKVDPTEIVSIPADTNTVCLGGDVIRI